MVVRQPVMAGRFYEADERRLMWETARLCVTPGDLSNVPTKLCGAVVPHAGWVCSGRLAGLGLATLAARSKPGTVVITGSVHTCDLRHPALDASEAWHTPLGDVRVNVELREAMSGLEDFAVLDAAHRQEHSLEVELPLIQHAFGERVKIVPVMIPPVRRAAGWGEAMGRLLKGWGEGVVIVCSVDLTHYGPRYGYTPAGDSDAGRQWAHGVNDRRLLSLVEKLAAEAIVDEAREHMNTCGGGALAATVAACRVMGATRGVTLAHSDSTTELAKLGHVDRENSVGYAAVVLG
jgi:hypothetical protein